MVDRLWNEKARSRGQTRSWCSLGHQCRHRCRLHHRGRPENCMLGYREQKGNGRVEGCLCTSSSEEPNSECSTAEEACYTSCTPCTAMHPERPDKVQSQISRWNLTYKEKQTDTNLCGDLYVGVIAQTLRVFIRLLLHLNECVKQSRWAGQSNETTLLQR